MRTRSIVSWTRSARKTSAAPRWVKPLVAYARLGCQAGWDARSGERLHQRPGQREGRRGVLAGVEVAVDDDMRVPRAAALLERPAGRTEPVLKQPPGLAGEASLLLFGVGEAGHVAP